MSILKRLFGGGDKPMPAEPEAEIYKEFRIVPEPIKAAGGFRVAARIEKEIEGALRVHRMIRADICESEDAAREHATRKARLMIDQQGDGLLDG